MSGNEPAYWALGQDTGTRDSSAAPDEPRIYISRALLIVLVREIV